SCGTAYPGRLASELAATRRAASNYRRCGPQRTYGNTRREKSFTKISKCSEIPTWKEKASGTGKKKKPNILVIWGDDIGISNLSCYSHGVMGYQTPNIDRLAKEGMMFNDLYGEQTLHA